MSEYIEQKKAFYKAAVDHGIRSKGELGKVFPLGVRVPERKLVKWLERLDNLPEFSTQRRYVNRFKLGADPEFVVVDPRSSPSELIRIDAMNLGLSQGLAFGADNNGRLAELRPAPSRSAVRVCASIMNTLRWMAMLKPKSAQFNWLAGAFLCGDGVGGHVHFGRKRPTRGLETNALDALSDILLALGVFPVEQVNQRRRGDRLHQLYGLPGDIRLQTHGYEYRTFPSWLASPTLAFFVLTLSKLAVHNPEMLLGLPSTSDRTVQARRLYNFLASYKEVDDDALLACYVLKRGFPTHWGWDFKKAWGVGVISTKDEEFPLVNVTPSIIPPTEEDVREMFGHLYGGDEISVSMPRPSWSPLTVPGGYSMLIDRSNTILQKGLGEIVWDLCGPGSLKVMVQGGGGPGKMALLVSPNFALPSNWQKLVKVPAMVSREYEGNTIAIPLSWREGDKAKRVKAALLSGAFPIWKVGSVKKGDYQTWAEGVKPKAKKNVKFPLSKVVMQSEEGIWV